MNLAYPRCHQTADSQFEYAKSTVLPPTIRNLNVLIDKRFFLFRYITIILTVTLTSFINIVKVKAK